jgi:large subunit ribosomal protein L23
MLKVLRQRRDGKANMQSRDVILNPVLSEKAVAKGQVGHYMFVVDARASKPEIKKAIEQHYHVEVGVVRTTQFRSHPRRQTRRRVENPGSLKKKAYITLKPGHSLKLFEVGE